jgi:hypothetical protein
VFGILGGLGGFEFFLGHQRSGFSEVDDGGVFLKPLRFIVAEICFAPLRQFPNVFQFGAQRVEFALGFGIVGFQVERVTAVGVLPINGSCAVGDAAIFGCGDFSFQ